MKTLLASVALLLPLSAIPTHSVAQSGSKDPARVLWRAPTKMSTLDWICGPGGCGRAPAPPFHFLRVDAEGSSPKVTVRDANRHLWSVKFGAEVIPECFGSRFVTALGYIAQPTYFVSEGIIEDTGKLPAFVRHALKKDGSFTKARFELRGEKDLVFLQGQAWAWNDNPFIGTHEFAGLKIVMMLLSNWDAKDARNSDESNNGVFRSIHAGSPELLYSVFDWGSSLGRWGNSWRRDKSDCAGYARDTPHFVKRGRNGTVEWGFSGKHAEDLKSGITVADVRWLLPYLQRITPEEMRTGLTASGATPRQCYCWAHSLEDRIRQLETIK